MAGIADIKVNPQTSKNEGAKPDSLAAYEAFVASRREQAPVVAPEKPFSLADYIPFMGDSEPVTKAVAPAAPSLQPEAPRAITRGPGGTVAENFQAQPGGNFDPMLSPKFVDDFRAELAQAPIENRLAALRAYADNDTSAYGRAARVILADEDYKNAKVTADGKREAMAMLPTLRQQPAKFGPNAGRDASFPESTPNFIEQFDRVTPQQVAGANDLAMGIGSVREQLNPSRQPGQAGPGSLKEAKANEWRSVGQMASDTWTGLSQGVISTAQLPLNIVAPDSLLAESLRDTQNGLTSQESEVMKAKHDVLRQRIDSEDGFLGKYAATVYSLVSDPGLGLQEAVKQIPNFIGVLGASKFASALAGGAVAVGGRLAPATLGLGEAISGGAIQSAAQVAGAGAGGLAASMVMAGGDAAGNTFERLIDPRQTPVSVWEKNPDYQKLLGAGKSSNEAIREIATAKARMAALITAPLGVLGFMGAEASMVAQGLSRAGVRSAVPQGAAKIFAKEIGGEQAEEGLTQLGGNYATRTVDPTQRLSDGVPEAMGTAAVVSAPFAGTAAYGERQSAQPVMPSPRSQWLRQMTAMSDVADQVGIPDKAMSAAMEKAKTLPPDQVPGFLDRFTQSLARRGLAKQHAPGEVDRIIRNAQAPVSASDLLGTPEAPNGTANPNQPSIEPGAPVPATVTAGPVATGPGLDDGPAIDQARPDFADMGAAAGLPGGVPDAAVNQDFEQAAHQAATSPLNDRPEPTDKQKEAGNYAKGHASIGGIAVTIENPAGSTRQGVDPDGTPWKTQIHDHYGYAKRTKGADGEQIDGFFKVGTPSDYSGPVFVIDQIDPKTGKFDEHKFVVGSSTEADARATYQRNYEPGWNGIGAITEMPMDQFKAWVRDGEKLQPIGNIIPALVEALRPPVSKSVDSPFPWSANKSVRKEQERNNPFQYGASSARSAIRRGFKDTVVSGYDADQYKLYLEGFDAANSPNNTPAASTKSASTGVAPTFTSELRPSGTLSVQGDFEAVKRTLTAGGIDPKKITKSPAGAVVGASQARQAQKILNKPQEPANAKSPEAQQTEAQQPQAPAAGVSQTAPKPKKKPAGARNLRAAAYDKNPLMTFLATHGLYHAKDDKRSQKSEYSKDKGIMVMGYGPVFKRTGKQPSDLVVNAIQDGYLPQDGTVEQLDSLIRRAISGEKISPLYSEGMAEQIGQERIDAQPQYEDFLDAAQQDPMENDPFGPMDLEILDEVGFNEAQPDIQAEFRAIIAHAESMGIDAEMILMDVTDQVGSQATQQEYHEAAITALKAAIEGSHGNGSEVSGAQSAEVSPTETIQEGLESYTEADVLATMERAEQAQKQEIKDDTNAEAMARDARIAKEIAARQVASAENFQLGQSAEDALAGQGDIFGTQEQPEATQSPTPAASQEELRAQADLQAALADLGDIFGQGTRLNMMPEQEAKILPVLVKLFDAAFRLGYSKFKDAAKFALDKIRAALGDAVADDITLEHLQGAYISMSSGKTGVDGIRVVSNIESKSEVEKHTAQSDNQRKEPKNVPSPDIGVERDRQEPGSEPAVGNAVSPGLRATDPATPETGGRATGSAGRGQLDGVGLSSGGTTAAGDGGDQRLPGDDAAAGLASVTSGDQFGERGADIGITGVPPEPVADQQVAKTARSFDDAVTQGRQQKAAASIALVAADLQNVRDTLPLLLPGQQEDVYKAEQRFANPTGYGMLFTNGTGTGKTFSGLGIIKRHELQGKTNVLILSPDSKIASDWIKAGKLLGLNISELADTKDAGKGIVITTYANFGTNDKTVSRQWDLVVADEAHTLMQDAYGTPTSYLHNLRAITYHPDGMHTRHTMLHRAEIERSAMLHKEIKGNLSIMNNDDTMDVMIESLRKTNDRLETEVKALDAKLHKAMEDLRAETAARQGPTRPRLVALSATPFAYEKTIDWANGYLFDYNDGKTDERKEFRGYNAGSNREQFFMQRLGYQMRYNKLTAPDPSKVDTGLLQRQFNADLKKAGSLSGRMLDVAPDYDRRFVTVDSAIGNRIDEALEWITDQRRAAPKGDDGYAMLGEVVNNQFKYLQKRYLLEAIKANEVIPIVKAHLALGRKVVVFHDYKKGGGFNPFVVSTSTIDSDRSETEVATSKNFRAALAAFNDKFKDLVEHPFGDMDSPIEVFAHELPDTMMINGDQKKADLLKRYEKFQDDASGPQVMLVQSAKNKGWSGHDTTGKHQRVLINLGQPTAPTLAIQQEGRIYRTGQASDAIMRYLNTGTNWERWTFASTIAGRASTAENLGMGEMARALKDSFIQSFDESDTYPPGHEGEGKGGKERDKAANNALTEYDRAKTHYWATQKKNSRTKAQEGADYFATPEPVGLKMVQWLDARPEESTLEPSAGHGAIARWLPDTTRRTVIEPSLALRSRLALVMNPNEDRIISGTFEELGIVNKYDGIAMNPPFGTAGRTAVDHLAKAATHLRDGGRIVALIPTGPAADKKFDKWFYESSEKPVRPLLVHPTHGPIHKGDTVTSRASFIPNSSTGITVDSIRDGVLQTKVVSDGRSYLTSITPESITGVKPTGKRTESVNLAEGLALVASVKLPQVTFERAGTAVATRIVVIEKNSANVMQRDRDFSDITDIGELFDALENLDFAARTKAAPVEPEAPAKPDALALKPAKAPAAEVGSTITLGGKDYPVEIYVTNDGKGKRGVWLASAEEARKINPDPRARPFKGGKDNPTTKSGVFLGEFWFPKNVSEPGATYGPVGQTTTKAFTNWYGDWQNAANGTPGHDAPGRVEDVDAVQRRAGVGKNNPAPAQVGQALFTGTSGPVGEDGRPMVIYHGTRDTIAAFDLNHPNRRDMGWLGRGVYGTSSLDLAELYAEQKRGNGDEKTMALFMAIKNPFVATNDVKRKYKNASQDAIDRFTQSLKDQGHDGVVMKFDDGHIELVAFEPTQVKSATDNNGNWDRTKAGIAEEPGQAYTEAPRRSYPNDKQGDMFNDQLDLFLNSQPDASQAGPAVEVSRRDAVAAVQDLHATPSVLAQALSSDYAARQRTNLVGQTVASSEDLAVLAQLYRDPRFETFRVIFTDSKGKVVSQIGLTSRLPGSTSAIIGNDIDAYLADLSRTAAQRGATSYYMLHNHPSGNANVSESDRRLTVEFNMPRMRFRGHVVIDTNEYSVINAQGISEKFQHDFGQSAPMTASQWGGLTFSNPMDVMAVAKQMQVDHDAVTLIVTDIQFKVMSVTTVPNSAITTDRERNRLVLSKAALQGKGSTLFAVGRNEALLSRLSGDVMDAVHISDAGDLTSLASNGLVRSGNPLPYNRRTRMSPDTSPEFGYLRPFTLQQMQGRKVASTDAKAESPQANYNTATLQPSKSPLDTILRKFGGSQLARITSPAYAWLARTIDSLTPEVVKAGLVADYGLREGYLDRKQGMKTAQRQHARHLGDVIDGLNGLDRQQSRVAYFWMQASPDQAGEAALMAQLPEDSRAALKAIKDQIDILGQEAVKLGMINAETIERNRMAYLHRSYQRYEMEDGTAKVSRTRAIKILGDQFKGRGMRDDADMGKIASLDWYKRKIQQGKADTSLKGEMFHRLELRATPDLKTPDMIGNDARKLGKLREIMYWPVSEPIPRHLADWRNDGTWEARFFDKSGKVGMWRDFTLDERTAMGEIQEVRYGVAKTIMQMSRDVETARFLDWVAKNEAVADESLLPEGAIAMEDASYGMDKAYMKDEWVKVPDGAIPGTAGLKRFGNLAGRWVPGPVWNDLRQISNLSDQGVISKVYSPMLRAWKISKTALSPATHMNNVMANFVMADAHDIQAKHLLQTMRTLATYKTDPAAKKLIELFQDHGGDGGMFNAEEIKTEIFAPLLKQLEEDLKKEGNSPSALMMASNVVALLKAKEIRQAFAMMGQTKTVKLASWPVQKLMKLYGQEDEFFRLAAFIKAKEDGLSDQAAGKFARESFLNYEINAPWVQALRRSFMPFIAFVYRAAPMMAKIAADRPWKIAKYMMVAGGLNALGYMMSGGDEDKERAFLPDEKSGKLWGVIPKLIRMPWNSINKLKDGTTTTDPVFLDVRRWIPVGDVVDTGQSQSAIPLPPPLIPGGPVVLLGEVIGNTSLFTGNDITKETDTLVEKYGKVADHLWKGAMPNMPVIPYTYSAESLWNAGKGKTDTFGREQSVPQAAASAFGIKLGTYAPDVLQANAGAKLAGEIAEIKKGIRSDARQVGRNGMSEADFDKKLDRAEDKINRISDEFDRKAGLADMRN